MYLLYLCANIHAEMHIYWSGCFLCSGHHSNTLCLCKFSCKPPASEARCSRCHTGFKYQFRCSYIERLLFQFMKKRQTSERKLRERRQKDKKVKLWIRLGMLRETDSYQLKDSRQKHQCGKMYNPIGKPKQNRGDQLRSGCVVAESPGLYHKYHH